MAASTCNVFVGSELGLLKGVNTSEKGFHNLNDVRQLEKSRDEIDVMCWADDQPHTRICCGLKSRELKLYDTTSGIYETILEAEGGNGCFKGLATYNGNYLTCVESGVVKVWHGETRKETLELNVGENVYRMRHNSYLPSQIATGGKENELKIWDLEDTKQPIFKAKNVKRDFLDLRVPVWITDVQFLSEGQKILSVTGYHQIRMYDPKTPQKRPVIDFEFDEYPLTSVALANQEHYVVVSNTHGRMALFDLRKKLLVHCYKGFAGSIRCIQCHPTSPQVASCGLDRFLRVHDIYTHKLIQKSYLKSRLNCLLFREVIKSDELSEEKALNNTEKVEDDKTDDLWSKMEQVSDDEKKPGKSISLKNGKRKRMIKLTKDTNILKRKLKIAN